LARKISSAGLIRDSIGCIGYQPQQSDL